MTGIKLELDGEWYEPKELAWVEWSPCGCLAGVSTVRDRFTPEQAWEDFHDHESKEYSEWMRSLGFRVELVTFEAYKAMLPMKECPHTPQWALPKPPTPEGMEWRISGGYFAKKTDRVHLFAPRPDGDRRPIASECGRQKDYGSFKTDGIGGHIFCTSCG